MILEALYRGGGDFGGPDEIRTRDLGLDRAACLAATPRDHAGCSLPYGLGGVKDWINFVGPDETCLAWRRDVTQSMSGIEYNLPAPENPKNQVPGNSQD